MKCLLFFLPFLILKVTFLSAQKGDEKKMDSIADAYYRNDKYDSAIVFYQKASELINLRDTSIFSRNYTYYFENIGDCYSKLGNIQQAKRYYYLSVQDTISDIWKGNYRRNSCLDLAEILIDERKYDSALVYLKLAEAKWPYFIICSAGEFRRKALLNYQFAICFTETNQLDSAITYLSPYVFRSKEDYDYFFYKKKDYRPFLRYYIRILKKKNSNREIKAELKESIKGCFYEKTFDVYTTELNHGNNYYEVLCYITFMGNKFVLIDNFFGQKTTDYYTKEVIIGEFKKTYLYRRLKWWL